MSNWINFKELRSKLDFEAVLRHYRVEVKRKGNQHHGFCPLPNHVGKRNSPSFSANLERGIFQCFGCGAKGNVLEFAALMQNVSLSDGFGLRKIALELQERFCPTASFEAPPAKQAEEPKAPPSDRKVVVVNAPLDFELKGLDYKHPYLFKRGFNAATIECFRLGFCSRGLLKDRIAIPLHDQFGKLIGYAGRVVDADTISENNPRYRLPGSRERNGYVYDFRKSLFLYNGFRIGEALDHLCVVEGFASVWWLNQNGIRNVVSTMGAHCSEEQAALIIGKVSEAGTVWIFPDANEAGRRMATEVFTKVAVHRSVRLVYAKEGTQPTDYAAEELHDILPF
jgi:DNA primase